MHKLFAFSSNSMHKFHIVFFYCFLVACNSGGSSSSTSSDAVKLSVNLPENSPLNGDELYIDVFDEQYLVSKDRPAALDMDIETLTDAYLMLSKREGDLTPTVYLFSSMLPGEKQAIIDPEETAISLIMNSIPRALLLQADEPSSIKSVIRENSKLFINEFVNKIEVNPYHLHLDNLENVYNATYMQAVQSSFNALQALELSRSNKSFSNSSYRSANYQVPEGLDLYVNPEYSHYGFRFDPIKEGNYVTGNISVTNDTSVYAFLTATDVVTNIEITPEPPTGIADLVFNENMLTPQQSFWGGYFSSKSQLDLLHRDAEINIITGGIKDLTEAEYTHGKTSAVQIRTLYSKILLPSLDTILELNSLALQKGVFGIMHNSGVFDTAIPLLYKGELNDAMNSVFDKLTENVTTDGTPIWPNPIVNEILNFATGVAVDKNAEYLAKIGLKLTAKKLTFWIWLYDMTAVFNDLNQLPAVITSTVRFPIDLADMKPKAINRRTGNTDQYEEITLSGHGFKTIQHSGGGEILEVITTGIDKDDKFVKELGYFAPSSLNMNEDGTSMTFSIPGDWLNEESTIENIEVAVNHHYMARDSLNRNIAHEITLPMAVDQDKFTIEIGGLTINAIDKSNVTGSETINISTTGMTEAVDFYTVFLKTNSGVLLQSEIKTLSNQTLSVQLPDVDDIEVGPASIFIQDSNGEKSNAESLTVIPEKVSFLPGTYNSSGEIELGMTQPQGLPNIVYTVNDATEQSYSAPITLQNKSIIRAWAIKKVNGIDYVSEKVEYIHSICEAGEDFINGMCIASCNRVCDNPILSNTLILPSSDDKHIIKMNFEKTFKYCTTKIEHPDYAEGKVTMFYLYTWDSKTAAEWDKIKADNGGELPYYSPTISPDSNYNAGTLEVIGTHTDKQVYLTPEPSINPNTSTIKYYTPEDYFGMIVYNYDLVSSSNKGDFLRVKIINDINNYTQEESLTILNPEVVEENGCYEGNN